MIDTTAENSIQVADANRGDDTFASRTIENSMDHKSEGATIPNETESLKNDLDDESLLTSKAFSEVDIECHKSSQPRDLEMTDNDLDITPSHTHNSNNEITDIITKRSQVSPPRETMETMNQEINQEGDDEKSLLPSSNSTSLNDRTMKQTPTNGQGAESSSNPLTGGLTASAEGPNSDDKSDSRIKENIAPTTRKRKSPSSNARGAISQTKQKTTHRPVAKLKSRKSTKDMVDSLFRKEQTNTDDADKDTARVPKKPNSNVDNAALKQAIKLFKSKCSIAGKEPNVTNNLYLVSGMKTSLRDYQLVGAAFMLRHEKIQEGPHGGIIADEMGLGKTLQTIACILAHRPTRRDIEVGFKTTLIVVPSDNLIRQWMAEFIKHTDENIITSTLHYKGDNTGIPLEALSACEIM